MVLRDLDRHALHEANSKGSLTQECADTVEGFEPDAGRAADRLPHSLRGRGDADG